MLLSRLGRPLPTKSITSHLLPLASTVYRDVVTRSFCTIKKSSGFPSFLSSHSNEFPSSTHVITTRLEESSKCKSSPASISTFWPWNLPHPEKATIVLSINIPCFKGKPVASRVKQQTVEMWPHVFSSLMTFRLLRIIQPLMIGRDQRYVILLCFNQEPTRLISIAPIRIFRSMYTFPIRPLAFGWIGHIPID
jgi:hypothetical protein